MKNYSWGVRQFISIAKEKLGEEEMSRSEERSGGTEGGSKGGEDGMLFLCA